MNAAFSPKPTPDCDWIHLRGVEVSCILGVYPAERTTPRTVCMDISLACDVRKAAATDRLEDAMNYEMIEAEAVAVAIKGKFILVETLAERVAEVCLRHAPVKAVRVAVDKPGALPLTKSVAVEILRFRPEVAPPKGGKA